MDKKKQVASLVLVWLVLFAVMYVRPLPVSEILPGFSEMHVTACEAKFCTIEANAEGKPVYKDMTKDLADEQHELMELFREEKFRQQLASAFYGGYRAPETQPYPRAEIRFTQGDTVYEIYVYTNYLAMGPAGALRDVAPVEKEKFTSAVMAFVRDCGETVATEVREFSSAADK